MTLHSIAFIPDGNRRYAQEHGISLLEAYRLGTQKAMDVMKWLAAYPSIRVGTFYTLSLKNLARSRKEVGNLFTLFEEQLERALKSNLFARHGIRLQFLGRAHLLPRRLQKRMTELEEKTARHQRMLVNLAIGYDGQAEIVDAAKRLAEDYKRGAVSLEGLDEQGFARYLYKAFPYPDLIVRTSGTHRLSGFLTYQSTYSELYFTQNHWPAFTKQELDKAIRSFHHTQRRFGK